MTAHPRWGRSARLFAILQGLSIVAVAIAPRATASTNAMVLNFTGLSDSYGVPIGDYYLAVASVTDQITQAGPSVTANPASWVAWSAHTAADFSAVALTWRSAWGCTWL